MIKRVLAGVVLFISVLFFPLWVSLLLAAAAMFYFPLFFEAPFLFLISDLLYAVPEERYFKMAIVSVATSIILLVAIEFAKKKIRLYSKKPK